MLGSCHVVTFILTSDVDRAKAFYINQLGLRYVAQDDFATVLDSNGVTLRLTPMPGHTPSQHPVLGWKVPDIAAAVTGLAQGGIQFERYSFLEQDELGIWTSPDGAAKVAFFKDPDGNLLSLTQ
ncbi:MAG: VOC family protein [Bryobacterales bacterium]|nr:VOC family protein [Bryobacterales bacterium]